MSSAYDELLDATLRHLHDAKERGECFVNVTPEALAALAQPPPRPVAAPAPAPVAKIISPTPAVAVAVSKIAPQFSLKPTRVSSPEKLAALAALRARALMCTKCAHLASSRRHVVFGVGSVDAELMFVGEAPGADEDAQGEPFVGAAGQLLTKIIATMGLSRESVYIANILKCRPDTPGETSGNRKPRPEEMATCIPFLHEQIDLIKPKVIVALGATAVEGLLGKLPVGITKLRGTWSEYRGTPLMPTYHPAYLLRNQGMIEKRKVWEDMLAAMEKLSLPITKKQRGFFLR
ncbi:MAG: Type-4 uracil-DNA glycosylase [Verrucomicrobiota bacterium]|jgi:DNA polymerase